MILEIYERAQKSGYKTLFLYGPNGSGKTLYVHALANELGAVLGQIDNLQTIKYLEQEIMCMKTNNEMNRTDENINMNNQMKNMIQQYKNQINELTSQLNMLHNENMSLQQNQRSMLSSNMDSRGYPRSAANDTSLQQNQL